MLLPVLTFPSIIALPLVQEDNEITGTLCPWIALDDPKRKEKLFAILFECAKNPNAFEPKLRTITGYNVYNSHSIVSQLDVSGVILYRFSLRTINFEVKLRSIFFIGL